MTQAPQHPELDIGLSTWSDFPCPPDLPSEVLSVFHLADSTAEGFHLESDLETASASASACVIDIGCVSSDVARWWAAILAPNRGWKTVISQQEDGDYFSPWSTSLQDSPSLYIKWEKWDGG
ncbi:hypothetical protein V8E54_006455 [Elaphomyces granulatus]